MKIDVLVPDLAPDNASTTPRDGAIASFRDAYEHAASLVDSAQSAERDFASGGGSLLRMTTERAQADIALSTAVAVATRISQIASTLGNLSL